MLLDPTDVIPSSRLQRFALICHASLGSPAYAGYEGQRDVDSRPYPTALATDQMTLFVGRTKGSR